jgi:hypothetical protein
MLDAPRKDSLRRLVAHALACGMRFEMFVAWEGVLLKGNETAQAEACATELSIHANQNYWR